MASSFPSRHFTLARRNPQRASVQQQQQQQQQQSLNYNKQAASIALTERLQEQLVFELHIDGSRQYLNMTVRGLYRYVLTAITTNPGNNAINANTNKTSAHQRSASLGIVASTAHPAVTMLLDEHPTTVNNDSNNNNNRTPLLASPRLSRTATVGGGQGQIPPPLALPNLSGGDDNNNNHNNIHATANVHVPPPPPPSRVPLGAGGPAAVEPITYRERLGGYLHPRDMRRLVTPFSNTNEPDLIVRRHVMLLNFDPLRAIILRDRLLVLVPDGTDSLLMHLEQRVRGGMDEVENSIFGSDLNENGTEHSVSASRHNNNNHNNENSQHGKPPSNHKGAASTVLSKILNRPFSRENLNDSEIELPSQHGSGGGDNHNNNNNGTVAEEEDNDEDDASSEMDEWHEMEARAWIMLPFELQCADAVLHVVGHMLTEDTMELQDEAQANIDKLLQHHSSSSMVDDPLTIIRDVKDKVQLMAARVKGFTQSLNRILDEDEDMALMNLSRLLTHPERFIQPVPQQVLEEESDEPELILEANLQVALTLQNNLALIHGKISTAKELIDQKQDATRNRLLLANMLISVLTLCVTMIATVGSFLGMNVPNPMEEREGAFQTICWTTIIGAFFMCMFIMLVLFQTGTIQRTPRQMVGMELYK